MNRHSKAEIYLHFVWATYRRLPLITLDVEPRLYACILSEVRKAGCETLALGGMPDHVHLAARLPPTISATKLMQQVKGVSSLCGRDLVGPGGLFSWQDGYGVYSFSRSHRVKVIAYVQNQKRHHATQHLWTEWEHTREKL